MFKKVLLLAALSGAIIGSGAFASSAQAATPTADPTKIFDLSRLDDTQRSLVLDALSEFDYDWAQLKPALKAKTGRTRIVIDVVDIPAKWNACGLAWPGGVVQIDDQVTDATWFQQVLMHEVGHMVDFFHLGPAKLRDKVAKIYGASWKVMNHNFNNGFIQVFSSVLAYDPDYPLTEAAQLKLRTLLGGSPALPVKIAL